MTEIHRNHHESEENRYDMHPQTSASIAFENIYLKSLRTAKKRRANLGDTEVVVPDELHIIIANAGERLGMRRITQYDALPARKKTVFHKTFADLYDDYQDRDQRTQEQIEELVEKRKIDYEHINPDGTFQANKIQESAYFLDNPKEFGQFELGTRQLPENNPHRQRATELYDIAHAGHNHDHEGHHDEHDGGACCPTHRKKEISLLRTQRKYGNYPKLAKAIGKVKELGWLVLCPGDDIANLANTVITPLLSNGDTEEHHHKEPNAYVPKTPLAVIHEATELRNDRGEWEIVDFTSAKVEDMVLLSETVDSFFQHEEKHISHVHDHHNHHGHGHGSHKEEVEHLDFDFTHLLITPLSARIAFYAIDKTFTYTYSDKTFDEHTVLFTKAKPTDLNPLIATANSVSLESRMQSYEGDGKTFSQRNQEWNESFWTELKIMTRDTVPNAILKERLKALNSLDIDISNESKDVTGTLNAQVEAFRKKYVGGSASDIGRFVEDISKDCRNHDGSVDLRLLEQRLLSIDPLLSAFGVIGDVHLLVKDFAVAHGILSQTGQGRQEIAQYAIAKLSEKPSESEEVRLQLLLAMHSLEDILDEESVQAQIHYIEHYANAHPKEISLASQSHL